MKLIWSERVVTLFHFHFTQFHFQFQYNRDNDNQFTSNMYYGSLCCQDHIYLQLCAAK